MKKKKTLRGLFDELFDLFIIKITDKESTVFYCQGLRRIMGKQFRKSPQHVKSERELKALLIIATGLRGKIVWRMKIRKDTKEMPLNNFIAWIKTHYYIHGDNFVELREDRLSPVDITPKIYQQVYKRWLRLDEGKEFIKFYKPNKDTIGLNVSQFDQRAPWERSVNLRGLRKRGSQICR